MSVASHFYSDAEANFRPMIDCQLEALLPLDLRLSKTAPDICDFGRLSELPVEILTSILEQLPLVSLIRFRNASQFARHLVHSMPKFELVVKHVPQAIRGLIAVQHKVTITLPELLEKLRQRQCEHCGKLAQNLWLPTASRLCFKCARCGPPPLRKNELLRFFRLEEKHLERIPSFRFLPATLVARHSANIFRVPEEHRLYDTYGVQKMAKEETDNWTQTLVLFCVDSKVRRFVRQSAEKSSPVVLPPDLVPRNVRRDMATIFAPWITGSGVVQGFFCKACQYTTEQDDLYTPADFSKHLEACQEKPSSNFAERARLEATLSQSFDLMLSNT